MISTPVIEKPAIEGIYPLSPLQEGLIFHSLYEPGAGVYVNQSVYLLEGVLDAACFARAWQRVSDRHQPLRTAVVWEAERQKQLVFVRAGVDLFEEDWRALSAAGQDAKLQAWLREDRRRGFDLTEVPLMRLALFRTAARLWTFVASHHHAILDGWSSAVLFAEALACHDSFRRGREPELSPAPAYSAYIEWLSRQDHKRAERYWRVALAEVSSPTRLPYSAAPRDRIPGRQRAALQLPLGPLRQAAAAERLTLNTVIQALWSVLLGRHSGQSEVVFGTTISQRPPDLPGAESMTGLLINTIPAAVHIDPAQPASEWMRALQAEWIEARQFGYLALTQLRTFTGVPAGTPVFETLVTFENYPADPLQAADQGSLRLVDRYVVEQDVFPLELIAVPADELRLQLYYEGARYSRGDAVRLLEHLQNLISCFVRNPHAAMGELDMTGERDRERIFTQWQGARRVEETLDVIEQFELRVQQAPDRVAVEAGGCALTYQALNRRANCWAAALRRAGVGAEVCAAVMLERSPDLVAAMLGIWKAGGVYVPVDPSYPPARVAYVLSDAAAAVLISERKFAGHSLEAAHILWAEDLGDAEAREPRASNEYRQLAYVIYTSGSTGQPKGAMIEHRGLSNHIAAKIEELQLTAADRIAQNAPSSFDISVWQMLAPLLTGGRVRVIGEEHSRDGEELLEESDRAQLTVLETVPALLGAMVEQQARRAARRPHLKNLRWLLCNAEPLSCQLCEEWSELYPTPGFLNLYGATECSDDVTHWPWSAGERGVAGIAPVGKPLRNNRLYILDGGGRPVAVGAPGELYVGGVGVGRGYWNRPALTAERYVPDPWGGEPGARMYRMGDQVAWRADGTLVFIGRMDRQVKVHGHRIEPAEIEAALRECPGVRQVAVEVSGQGAAARLIGYVEADPGLVTAATLKAQLQARLPAYLIPAAFAVLEKMPLSPNGKVDRRALPMPAVEDSEWQAPQTPFEQTLANIWAQLLRRDRIGREDDFFELGGDSILATQAISRIRAAFETEVPLRALFEQPTLSAFAARIVASRMFEAAPPVERVRRDLPLPLSFAQQRLWFIDQFQPASAAYNMALGSELEGALDAVALEQACAEIIRRHEVLRTAFYSFDGRPALKIVDAVAFHIPLIDLSGLPMNLRDQAAHRVTRAEARFPFDLGRPPMVRVTLIRLGMQRHFLRVTFHHIVSDGWSTGVLSRELTELYRAFCQGRPSPLRELPIQYVDFAAWQHAWLQGETLDRQVDFWRRTLAGCPSLELPTDFARPAVANYRAGEVRFTVDRELSADLNALSRREGATLFMTLLAAWQILLGRYSGQNDFAVGSPIANRTRVEVENLIGFFVNTLVLRAKNIKGSNTFTAALRQVRKTTLDAFERQDLPFEKLIEELKLERDMSRSPLFQVMLVVQNTPQDDLNLGDVRIRGMHTEQVFAPFEMILAFTEEPDGTMDAVIQYAADLFTEQRIERLIGHLQALLQEIVTDPGRPIEELEWLTEAERRQLLSEWKRKGALTEPRLCAHELFQRQAERVPERIAVIDGGQQISYRELNRRANQWAHALRAKGVGPEQAVGLLLDRGADLVIATLAVLKAGGAYVPLDPDYPTERIAYMLRDSQARCVLTQPHLNRRIPAGLEILYVDHSQVAGESDLNPAPGVLLDNLAHVIYTSGSTGEPKGVGVTHAGVSFLLSAIRERICRTDAAVMLQFASWSFDAATWEWAGALLQGGRLALGRREEMLPGMGLERILREHQVDVAALPPSVLGMLEPEGLEGLHTLVTAAEACPPELVGRWSRGREFFNGYGQTETTVAAVVYGPMQSGQMPRIGQPLAGVEVFVLDGDMRPVPVGVPGELLVGGEGLTRGYVRQPALTAEKFVPHPYSEQPGARLYRTGDRAQWTENGELEFVGRVDAQVKLRGYRIDLGEIETILGRQEGVRQAVVTLREDEPGRKQLAAYVVGEPGQPLDGEQLRASLQARLPEFMVPAAVIRLERFPLTSNGKVDKRALPGLRASRESTHPGTGARTPVEEILAGIWMQVLKLDRVDAQDDFFALGGHSLLATQVVSRIRSLLHIDLPLRALFEATTFEKLAQRIAGQASPAGFEEDSLDGNLANLPEDDIDLLISALAAQTLEKVG